MLENYGKNQIPPEGGTPEPERSLAARAQAARRATEACDLCAFACGVRRADGEKGRCGLGPDAFYFRDMLVYGVELELVPAHAIYLTGCNLRCPWCNVSSWNEQPESGRPWDPASLAKRIRRHWAQGARSLLFLGGEPTVNLPAILDLLAAAPNHPPVAWDSNMLFSDSSRQLLRGVVDLYVADLKFGNDACAMNMAGVDHYLQHMEENLVWAEQTARLIVRHLMLPGHWECCTRPALEWIKARLRKPRLSLRWEYLPPEQTTRDPRLLGSIAPETHQKARQVALALGIELTE